MMMHLVRRASLALALGMTALVASGGSARAEFINGTVNLSGFANLTPTSLLTAQTFDFFTADQNNVVLADRLRVGGPTGSFSGIPTGAVVATSDLIINGFTGLTINFGTVGQFTATTLLFDQAFPVFGAAFRNIVVSGNFLNGGNISQGILSITLTQQGGVNVASVAADLSVTGVIPEPASMAMLAMGGVGMLGAARRNRKA